MRWLQLHKSICCLLLFFATSSAGFSIGATAAAGSVLKDYSKDAIDLFNNMRSPAALLSGGLVPLGIMTAPAVKEDDTTFVKIVKKANVLLGVASLLSEIIAVTYSSIAINKLVELPSPLTTGVVELLRQKHEMAWLGTNIHFLFGMMGFGLIVGNRVFLEFGNPVGKLAIGFSVSFFFQALSVVNKGIAMGDEARFATNFFCLSMKYASLVAKNSTTGICSIASVTIAILTTIQMIRAFYGVANANTAKLELD
jgi:hypothetical protein